METRGIGTNAKVEDTLSERGKNYGDYKGGCDCRVKLMEALTDRFTQIHGMEMPQKIPRYLHDIVNKLSRLASTPDHVDSWHDIAGYAN